MNKVPVVVTQLSRVAPQSLSPTTGAATAIVDSRRTSQSQQNHAHGILVKHHGWDNWRLRTAREIEMLRNQAADMAMTAWRAYQRPVERQLR